MGFGRRVCVYVVRPDGRTVTEHRPQAVVMAGPNGSGKSTCAELLLPSDMEFINADVIAQQISGERSTTADLAAGRILLARISELQDQGRDFALETTLATKMLEPRIQNLRAMGYECHLFFLYLPSDDLAVERVAARVRTGGHDVPEATVRRRYAKGLRMFFTVYRNLFDCWRMYDNSRIADPQLIASGAMDDVTQCVQPELFKQIEEKWADV